MDRVTTFLEKKGIEIIRLTYNFDLIDNIKYFDGEKSGCGFPFQSASNGKIAIDLDAIKWDSYALMNAYKSNSVMVNSEKFSAQVCYTSDFPGSSNCKKKEFLEGRIIFRSIVSIERDEEGNIINDCSMKFFKEQYYFLKEDEFQAENERFTKYDKDGPILMDKKTGKIFIETYELNKL